MKVWPKITFRAEKLPESAIITSLFSFITPVSHSDAGKKEWQRLNWPEIELSIDQDGQDHLLQIIKDLLDRNMLKPQRKSEFFAAVLSFSLDSSATQCAVALLSQETGLVFNPKKIYLS